MDDCFNCCLCRHSRQRHHTPQSNQVADKIQVHAESAEMAHLAAEETQEKLKRISAETKESE